VKVLPPERGQEDQKGQKRIRREDGPQGRSEQAIETRKQDQQLTGIEGEDDY
jgi:hypothetical protein